MDNAKEIIKALEFQLAKTSEKNFDTESWKKYNIQLIKRIFGPNDERLKQIEEIDSEFNSWSLRDASGNESYKEKAKLLAAEIIQSVLDELKLFGLPSNHNKNTIEKIRNIVFDELKGSQTKLINSILNEDLSAEEKKRRISEILSKIDTDDKTLIITNILLETLSPQGEN